MKLGRNQPCWCGSGLKYKKCHLGRDKLQQLKHWEIGREQRKAFSKRVCLSPKAMHENCSSQIVKAHTIPKSGSLRQVARDGHVYGFVPSMENLRKHKGKLVPELIGINSASTFSGFCSIHDNLIFAPLEDVPFSGTDEQYFLLAYRAIAKELYAKEASANLGELRSNMDKGRSEEEQFAIQEQAFLFNIGVLSGFKTSKEFKSKCDEIIESGEYELISFARISIEGPPCVMASGGYFPEVDFNGNELQDVGDITAKMDQINVSLFYGDANGEIVFTWLQESNKACEAFIKSLLEIDQARIGNAVIRFLFEACENIYLEPTWWEGLNRNEQNSLIDRMMLSVTPTATRSNDCLMDDDFNYVRWNILNIETRF